MSQNQEKPTLYLQLFQKKIEKYLNPTEKVEYKFLQVQQKEKKEVPVFLGVWDSEAWLGIANRRLAEPQQGWKMMQD